jgi:CubicO group peptidase (beta-lactamase class C family)
MTYCYENNMFNGTILIANKGKVIYKNYFGYSDMTTMEPLILNSQFYLASVSKTLTSTAIMFLKEQNKINYEDKISYYIPELAKYANQVSIRQVLTHTSGIPNWTKFNIFRSSPGNFIDNLTNKDIFDFLVRQDSLDFTPGAKHSYSNSGYMLLAMIVEKVSDMPFRVFMKENIFDSLGMNNTVVYDESKPEIPNKVIGYNMFGEEDDYNLFTYGPGGIYSTIEDLYKFDQALYTEKLISKKTLQEALEKPKLNNGTLYENKYSWSYGFGWQFRRDSTKYVMRHSGGFNGFSTVLYRELNNQNSIIILTNKGENTWQRGQTMVALINILDDRSYQLPEIPIALEMKKMVDQKGVTSAIAMYNKLKKTSCDKYDFSENQLNILGYYYLNKQKLNEAKAIFKLNIEIYPDSANTYDSFGEACMANGDLDEAIKNYQRSLELNPDNTNATKMLKIINENNGCY